MKTRDEFVGVARARSSAEGRLPDVGLQAARRATGAHRPRAVDADVADLTRPAVAARHGAPGRHQGGADAHFAGDVEEFAQVGGARRGVPRDRLRGAVGLVSDADQRHVHPDDLGHGFAGPHVPPAQVGCPQQHPLIDVDQTGEGHLDSRQRHARAWLGEQTASHFGDLRDDRFDIGIPQVADPHLFGDHVAGQVDQAGGQAPHVDLQTEREPGAGGGCQRHGRSTTMAVVVRFALGDEAPRDEIVGQAGHRGAGQARIGGDVGARQHLRRTENALDDGRQVQGTQARLPDGVSAVLGRRMAHAVAGHVSPFGVVAHDGPSLWAPSIPRL